jgi:uncharacterized protein YbjQ (UPF0145 family)
MIIITTPNIEGKRIKDYEVLGEKNGMQMVSVSGTAVIVE